MIVVRNWRKRANRSPIQSNKGGILATSSYMHLGGVAGLPN